VPSGKLQGVSAETVQGQGGFCGHGSRTGFGRQGRRSGSEPNRSQAGPPGERDVSRRRAAAEHVLGGVDGGQCADDVFQLAAALTASGVKQEDIAVITPYRQQIKLLTGLFVDLPRVEILTADKSQGRDKDCVLISLVRSNEVGYVSRPSLILISVSVPKGGMIRRMDSPDADSSDRGLTPRLEEDQRFLYASETKAGHIRFEKDTRVRLPPRGVPTVDGE
jgi:hypothetical protein